MKRYCAGVLILAVVLCACGCADNAIAEPSAGVRIRRMKQRECLTNDAPCSVMVWKEFRPFRVSVPLGVEVKCCCVDDGRLELSIPGVVASVTACVLDRSVDVIGGLIESYQVIANGPAGEIGRLADDGWYMEKKFQDRRMLMDVRTSSSGERTLRCFCDLDSGALLLFLVDLPSEVDDSIFEQLWGICRDFKFESKCADAFCCSAVATPLTGEVLPLPRLKWKDLRLDLGDYEWKSLRQLQVFVPSCLDVECCGIDDEDFVFDLPGSRHYVTAVDLGEDTDVIDNQVKLYALSSAALKGRNPSEEKLGMQYALTLRQMSGADWFIDERFSDRRLVVEHRQQGARREGITCYCELDKGPTMRFRVRGRGVISGDEIDYFLMLCRIIKVRRCASAQ